MHISTTEASRLLNAGHVVALPTETVYGLAASLTQPEAIGRIFQLKGRPANNPLIIHLAEADQARLYSDTLPPGFTELAHAFWPGPLTLVIPIIPERIPNAVRAGLLTAGFRIPSHPLARDVIKVVGPLVMPSANLSGKPSATQAAHIEVDFGAHFPVVDGGCCSCGLESTILTYRLERWQMIRLGALPAESFTIVLGYIPEFAQQKSTEAPLCPGQLYRHYAPQANLILCTEVPTDFTGTILGFKERQYPASCNKIILGSLSEPEKVAETLYAVLRQLDQDSIKHALVDMRFPQSGLWVTISERLSRASVRK